MGLFFIPFGLFVIIGASNAVNLTDGLDGLATVPVMLVALSFTLISYVVGNTIFSEYLQIQYIPDVGELSIFCGSVVGSCLGFLWYNAPPAKIFMGDRSEEHTSELQSRRNLVCRLLLEKKGWAESTIVIRFWIIAIILALVGLATLKLR